MRIAVSAAGPSLEAQVDPRFGRCQCFLIVNTDDMSFEAIENPNTALGGGAGIQSAQLMSGKGVEVVLTGNCGPNAHQTLSAAGIGVIVGCGGSVADVVERFKAGQLGPAAGEPNVASHFGSAGTPAPDRQQPPMAGGGGTGGGMGQGGGRGMGQGGGRGMGQGGGRGMGQGGGRGMGQGGGRGMGQGGGRGMGQGGGRGMGQGGGRGMGQAMSQAGMGQGMGAGMNTGLAQAPPMAPQPQAPGLSRDAELRALKEQADAMSRQTQQIEQRIRELQQGETPAPATTEAATVDAERCTGCAACFDVCTFGAISFSHGIAVVDPCVCTACGMCVDACQTEAISLP